MPPITLTSPLLFFILLIIWASCLFGGFIFGKANAENTRRMLAWTRMASSFTLMISGWLWMFAVRDTPYATLALFFATGMTLGWIGDLFMAQWIPLGNPVLGGMVSFGLGHIAYIAGLLQASSTFALSDNTLRWGSLILWLLIAVILWYLVVFRGSEKSVLHYAALPYSLLLATTSGLAFGLALQSSAFVLIALGTILFLISDLILATELFNGANWRYIGDVVWLTYGPGQMLIVLGMFITISIQ